jgi:large subunit ribosomal protein L6
MSRIGKQSIEVPQKVKIKLEKQKIFVEGPKGSLFRILPSVICCTLDEENNKLFLEKAENTRLAQALYGLSRTLVANMVIGVSNGFSKKLQISGVGYRAQLEGTNLVLNMGYSHPVKMVPPPGVSVSLEGQTTIIVSGIELDIVGEFAAKIRSVRPPEPYKGKGIAYDGEFIRRKVGKTGK